MTAAVASRAEVIRSTTTNSSVRRGVADEDLEHEPVDLGLGQRVGALRLDGVLGRHDEERVGRGEGLAADRDLPLLHDLQQGALHLGRRAVDLVGEHEVGEDRAERDLELTLALVVDARADDVGRHQVGRELDPLELAADRLGEGLDRHRLGQARHPLDEQVPAGEQRDEHPLQQQVLPDDRLLDLVEGLLQRVRRAAAGPCRSWVRWSVVAGRWPAVYWCGLPAAPPAVAMGTAKPTPTKKACWAGLARPVTMPMTWPSRLSSGPPLLPGFTAASNWMRPVEVAVVADLDRPVQRRHDPGGQRSESARAGGPRRTPRHRPVTPPPRTAGTMTLGGCWTVRTAMSLFGWRVATCAGRLGAVGEAHLHLLGTVDDVQRGEDRAVRVDDDARPQPHLSIRAGRGPFTGDDDEGGQDGLVCRRCVWRGGALVPLGLLQPLLDLRVDVGPGERGRTAGADPPQRQTGDGEHHDDDSERHPPGTSPAPLRLVGRRHSLGGARHQRGGRLGHPPNLRRICGHGTTVTGIRCAFTGCSRAIRPYLEGRDL